AHRGAGIVNEAGSLNFNGLNTRDVAGAKAFYGAVFGWQTLTLNGGADMWTLPGYGDHLEELNPGTRARMAEVGAPRGFEDVVASINVIAAYQHDVPPHLKVTFASTASDATTKSPARLDRQLRCNPL